MGKRVDVPVLVSVSVDIEDDTLTREDLINKAIDAAHTLIIKVNDSDVEVTCGDGVSLFVEGYEAYEKICEGNYYYGHISEISIEDY